MVAIGRVFFAVAAGRSVAAGMASHRLHRHGLFRSAPSDGGHREKVWIKPEAPD
jgi:hypothetical protein